MKINKTDYIMIAVIAGVALASGGYYTLLAPLISAVLLIYLLFFAWRTGLVVYRNLTIGSLLLLLLGFAFSALWATDHAMETFGFVRFLPVFLCGLLLMQEGPDAGKRMIQIVPWIGAGITILSWVLQYVPVVSQYILINGRFSGTFQYANTYALFLLLGLAVLATEEKMSIWTPIISTILLLGVLATGSRTSFLLVIFLLAYYCWRNRNWKRILTVAGVFAIGFAGSFVVSKFSVVEADRYLTTTSETSTLLVRLLYYKDALPVIVKHPGGLGYLGYYLLQSSFQTGVYSVRYVHNELLQMFLDVGWMPTVVFCVALFISFFKKGTSHQNRLILLTVCAHAMMDFDLQFLSIWFVLVPAMDLWSGKAVSIKKTKAPLTLAAVSLLAVSIWLGTADFLYTIHNIPGCLRVMPNHTMALIETLPEITDVEELEERADQIIRLNPYAAVAHSAKGNAAFGKGDILKMMAEKEEAIRLAPYYLDGYLDYFDKLDEVMKRYEQMGDFASAEICREKILEIPDMLEQVKAKTSPIAWKIQHIPELELPKKYQNILKNLEN